MSKSLRLALLALAGLLCLSFPARAETAVVRGQVFNGTAGANATLGGLPVRLYVFSGTTLKDTLRATTDAQGLFRFEGVPAGEAWVAVASVEYGGVSYESQFLDLSAGSDFNGDIAVYETTTDDSALVIGRSHLIIEMGVGQLEVTEMVILENTGDRTYVGTEEVVPGQRATARVPLPAGATDVSFDSSEVASAMVRTGEGFVDTRPIAPGQHEYVLSYALPCEGSTYNLLKPLYYPATVMDVLVAAPGAEVEAPALERLGTREAPGVSYVHLAGRALGKGTDIVLRFSGLDKAVVKQAASARGADAPAGAGREPLWRYLAPLLAMGGLAFALLVHLRRTALARRLLPATPATAALANEQDRLLVEIAELDDRYEAGEMDEASHRKQREMAKSQLLSLMYSAASKESDASGSKRARARRHPGARPRKEVRPGGSTRRSRP